MLNVIGTNTFQGQTTVSYGTLSLQNVDDAGTGAGSVTVTAGSTLDGTGGTQGEVDVQNGGILTPGTANGIGIPTPGSLATGSVTLEPGSTFDATVNGTSAGASNGYDQLTVNGSLTIGNGSILSVSGSLNAAVGTVITLIQTNSAISTTSRFANAADGSQIVVGDDICSVSYDSAGGEDLTLTVMSAVPVFSIVQQAPMVIGGEPSNFELDAVGDAAAEITDWSVNFGDGQAADITAPANISAGGEYRWFVQHVFASASTSYSITANATGSFGVMHLQGPSGNVIPMSMGPNDVYVNAVAPPSMTDPNPTTVVSSTQINVCWVYNTIDAVFDSFEIAAADTSVSPLDFKVVAAGTGSGYVGSALVSGLKPGTTYQLLVYGVSPSGSVCSINSVTATTADPISIEPTVTVGPVNHEYSVIDDLKDNSGNSADLTYAWQGFDDYGNPVPFTNGGSTTGLIFTGTQDLGSITAVATLAGAPAGAFDSITYYNVAPTIVVTGTSGNDTFNVSINSNGAYTITGSVTPIPPFYAPDGVDLQIHGRGGSDRLVAGNGTHIVEANNPSSDGTDLSISGTVVLYDPTVIAPPPPPANLTLPAPASNLYPTIPTTGDTFTPPVSGTGAAEITQATATAEPGDVIALTAVDVRDVGETPSGQGTEPLNTQFWVYGQTTGGNRDWEQAGIVSEALAGTSGGNALAAVSIQLPSTLPAHSIYLLYEVNTDGTNVTYSQPYVINQPQVWWTDQNNAYVGGKVSVFGTNLSYGVSPQPYSDQSWVYLFPETSGSVPAGTVPIMLPETAVAPDPVDGSGAMDVNAYKVDFDLPASVAAGSYQVEIYNGHGGVYGLSSPTSASVINIAPALDLVSPPLVPLALAYCYSQWFAYPYTQSELDQIWIGQNPSSDLLDPSAVNDAISWAYDYHRDARDSNGNPFSYVGVQLPPGEIDVTDTTVNDPGKNDIYLMSYVHLAGAGDTGSPVTGTVIAGAAPGLTDLVKLDNYAGATCIGAGVSDLMLKANGNVTNAVIYDNGLVAGFVAERLTIDATNGNPANPGAVEDVKFDQGGASHLQFLDSTFIGQGISASSLYSTYDNCHFVGCGGAGAQISTFGSANLAVTRCTDTSLVNNITSPGGNVEYDAACRLLACSEPGPDMYAGDNITSGLYDVPETASGTNGGEQILMEPAANDQDVAVYQNILAGDGAEAFLSNGCGVLIQCGANIIVADNDISGEMSGIQVYYAGNYVASEPFDMYTGNSIHDCYAGILIKPSEVQLNTPWFIGNSFSGNIINGASPGSIGLEVVSYVPIPDTSNPPEILMNIFDNDIVTGGSIGILAFQGNYGVTLGQIGTIVISNSFLSSDGSNGSTVDDNLDGLPNPFIVWNDASQGYWC